MTDVMIMLAHNGLPGRFFVDRREIAGVTACSIEHGENQVVVVNLSIAPMDLQILPAPKARRAAKLQGTKRGRR